MDRNKNIVPTRGRHGSLGRGLLFFIVGFSTVCLTLPGCSPRIIEKVVYQHDTTVVHKRDSIIRRDSVYVKEWMKGDTVFIEKYKDRYIYRDRWRDSIRVVRDSVAVEHINEVKVEQPLSWWKRAKLGAFWWLCGALVAALAWIFRKPILSLLKL